MKTTLNWLANAKVMTVGVGGLSCDNVDWKKVLQSQFNPTKSPRELIADRNLLRASMVLTAVGMLFA